MTGKRVVYSEMYLAHDKQWDDNVTIIPEFDLVDVWCLFKQHFELYESGVHYFQEYFESNLLLLIKPNRG
jgi:hypothetical protein